MFLKGGLKLDKHIFFFNIQDDLKTLTREFFGSHVDKNYRGGEWRGYREQRGEFCRKSGCWVDCRSVSGERVFKEVIKVK